MKKRYSLFGLCAIFLSIAMQAQIGSGSRMNEIFKKIDLVPSASGLNDPWEVTYGPDDSLWITESKGYKVYKMDPTTGVKRTVLDISQKSTWLGTTPASDSVFNLQFVFSPSNPQGGLAGLAIHPDFMNVITPKKYVYVSYIRSYLSTSGGNGGVFYQNRIVRFTYNPLNGKLASPVSLCDTLPGSSDHNSQRMIIAPVSGVYYLFYAQGDMGAGQFGNASRTENAQNLNSYEGKILRFNLESDGDAGLDAWIPNDNPFNTTSPAKQSAIYSLGIRNNQGFAFAKINGVDHLYGSSHGPFSDDEVNIIKKSANYGHPLVIGYSTDGNYDGAGAGNTTTFATGNLPPITSEATNAAGLANYTDPIYTFYPAAKGDPANPSTSPTNSVQRMYWDFNHGSQGNGAWPSEAPSGLDIYSNSMIPGWKNSLLLGSLKGGKVIRLQLNSTGDAIVASPNDTINYFRSVNRFRDIAISPDGLSVFAVIDKSSTTSGPTTGNPIISACAGCVEKYTFLGYASSAGTSTIPNTISIASGITNSCTVANTININATNDTFWVPITDTNSNVIAEINANGNILGNVTTSLYVHSGTVRERGTNKALYLDRNMTITPQTQPSTPVSIRLYLSAAEFNALKNATNSVGQPSGVGSVSNLSIFKNSDVCSGAMGVTPAQIVTINQSAFGAGGYVLQGNISSFSTFYVANTSALLPVNLLSFTGSLFNNISHLQWVTEDEQKAKTFAVEQSTNARDFNIIGTVGAGNHAGKINYAYSDSTVSRLAASAVYYRLKIIDADGKFNYSDVITLNLNKSKSSINVHPNPVVNVATIEVNAAVGEKVNWEVTDITGKTVLKQYIVLLKGENTFNINLGEFPAGMYYLKITGNNINQSVKLQKL
jgi:PQQ-dependent dehydrogenase (s-GDH family)